MRSEREMFELILDVARNDKRIRAVTLEGSRTNPNVPKDMFQDFDIGYLVTETDSFMQDPGWVNRFGERIIMQLPEAMAMFPPESGRRFSYLMLFTDGNRIDLTLIPLDEKDRYVREDKLLVVLLDKDGCLPPVPPPTDEDYRVKRPSAEYFADCCNEFWWVSTYVAKGLWRKELLYAQEHLNRYVRPMLMKMLEWKIGFQTGFTVSIGKCGKYAERFVSEPTWEQLTATYADGSYEGVWRALFAACELFRATALEVAEHLGIGYPLEEDRRVTHYLECVRKLPPDASDFGQAHEHGWS